jgi:hypothetical protein
MAPLEPVAVATQELVSPLYAMDSDSTSDILNHHEGDKDARHSGQRIPSQSATG